MSKTNTVRTSPRLSSRSSTTGVPSYSPTPFDRNVRIEMGSGPEHGMQVARSSTLRRRSHEIPSRFNLTHRLRMES